MRQLLRHDTVPSVLLLMLFLHVLFVPILSDIRAAENSGPIVSYFPMRVGRYGQPVTVRVHARSDVGIAKVTLVVQNENEPLRGKMPKLDVVDAPVEAHAIQTTKLYAGPSEGKRVKAMIQFGDVLNISMEQGGFYRVQTQSEETGFVQKKDVDILTTGNAYAVTLPASITSRPVLTFSVEVIDNNGAMVTTNDVTMRLLTDEEIDGFIAANVRQAGPKGGKPIHKKPFFWVGMAALAGGAYYLSTDRDGADSNQGAVNVLVEWE